MKTMKLFLAFVLMMIIGIFAISFTNTAPTPTAGTTAASQYSNLTQAISISSNGLYAVLIIIIIAMVFSAVLFFGKSLNRRSH